MTRHIIDKSAPRPSRRAIRTFLRMERAEASGGISRLVARLDRQPGRRTGARLPAFLRIDRGREA